jgi:hypothetical protein
MEGFDTMAMPPYHLASPMSLGNLQGTDYLNAMSSLDMPDHRSTFDTETFVRWVNRSPSGTRGGGSPLRSMHFVLKK